MKLKKSQLELCQKICDVLNKDLGYAAFTSTITNAVGVKCKSHLRKLESMGLLQGTLLSKKPGTKENHYLLTTLGRRENCVYDIVGKSNGK